MRRRLSNSSSKGLGQCNTKNSIMSTNPTPMRENSTNSSKPRRILFTTAGDCKDLLVDQAHSARSAHSAHSDTNGKKTKKTLRFAPLPTKPKDPVKDSDSETANDKNSSTVIAKGQTPSITAEERRELWYQDDELAAMKQEARLIVEKHKNILENPSPTSAERELVVGLERFCRQRAVWKRSATHHVLMAQREAKKLKPSNMNLEDHRNLIADYIQHVSLRCTGWARETATTQGFRDYCAVHDPLASLFSDEGNDGLNYDELIFGDSNNTDKESLNSKTDGEGKRKLPVAAEPRQQIEDNRRVRQRTVPIIA